jgi:transcriptional regulator with XRE-family HTH domain
MEQYRINFANNLKRLRNGRGVTIRRLESDLNISKTSISEYENMQSIPGLDVAKKIADYFNTTVQALIEEGE